MMSLLKPLPTKIDPGYRFETKVPLDRSQFEQYMPALYELGLYPTRAYPPRRISSIYYDTPDLDNYSDNVSGISNRRKTRIRWYNDDRSKLTLEQKIKKNKASTKQSFFIANPQLVDPALKNEIVKLLNSSGGTNEALSFRELSPTLAVQYERQYFTLANDLRMTIDTSQKFKRLYPLRDNDFTESPVYAVVEFKYPAETRLKMQSVLRDLPFRVFRHSKYVIGMDCTAQ